MALGSVRVVTLVCSIVAALLVVGSEAGFRGPCTTRRRAVLTDIQCGDGVEGALDCPRWAYCDVDKYDFYPATCCCLRTIQDCPEDLCCGAICPEYPAATCIVDSCRRCQARFYNGREDVTTQCCPEGYTAKDGLCHERFCANREIGEACAQRRPEPHVCAKMSGFVRCTPEEDLGSGSGDGGVEDDQEGCDV